MDFGITAKLTNKMVCKECWRSFDLTVEDDAQEFYYGHDCEDDSDIYTVPDGHDCEPEDLPEQSTGGALGVSQG